MELSKKSQNLILYMGWSKYWKLNINERINAKSIHNSLNINYIMSNTMDGVRLVERDYSAPAIYSRACKQWFERVYHK